MQDLLGKFMWMTATLPKTTSDERKIGLFMTKAGDEAIDVYDTLNLPDSPTLKAVLDAFDKYVQMKKI
jgi:hypothetical protein